MSYFKRAKPITFRVDGVIKKVIEEEEEAHRDEEEIEIEEIVLDVKKTELLLPVSGKVVTLQVDNRSNNFSLGIVNKEETKIWRKKKSTVFRGDPNMFYPDWNFLMSSKKFRKVANIFIDDNGTNYGRLPLYSPLWNNQDNLIPIWIALPSASNLDELVDFPEIGNDILVRFISEKEYKYSIVIINYVSDINPTSQTTAALGMILF